MDIGGLHGTDEGWCLAGVVRHPDIKKGRRPKHNTQRKDLALNYQTVCERRVNSKYKNCEVLNSYWVGKDGKYYWYEVIMIDRNSPSIQKDSNYKNIAKKIGRVYRGLT